MNKIVVLISGRGSNMENLISSDIPGKFVLVASNNPHADGLKRAKNMGWIVKEQDPGEWRRVVPSPDPDFVMHGISIRTLVHAGIVVLAAGGGGIPVFVDIEEDYFLVSAIDGNFEGWSGSTIFRLKNGQIWQQRLSGKWKYNKQSPAVRIKKNFFGYFVMRVDDRKSIGAKLSLIHI